MLMEYTEEQPQKFTVKGFFVAKNIFRGSYPFPETNFQDFSMTFPWLRLFFQGL